MTVRQEKIYGEDAVTDGTCLKSIGEFDAGGFSGAVAARVGGPLAVESHPGHMWTEDRPGYGTWNSGDLLKVSESCVENHLYQHSYISLF